jgi:galactokinase
MQRCRFVIEENIRVHEMANALERKDAMAAGELIKASHTGLQYDYEVSCDELDHIAAYANSYDGVYGARMMGGGFGGCVLCLVDEKVYQLFISSVAGSYARAFALKPEVIEFDLGKGVEIITYE